MDFTNAVSSDVMSKAKYNKNGYKLTKLQALPNEPLYSPKHCGLAKEYCSTGRGSEPAKCRAGPFLH